MIRKYSIYSNSTINRGAVVIELNEIKEWSREERQEFIKELDQKLNGASHGNKTIG